MFGFIVVNLLCGCLYEALKRKHSLTLALSHLFSIGHHRKSHFCITVCSQAQASYKDIERGSEVMNIQIIFTKVKTVNRRNCFIEKWPIASVLPAVGGYG